MLVIIGTTIKQDDVKKKKILGYKNNKVAEMDTTISGLFGTSLSERTRVSEILSNPVILTQTGFDALKVEVQTLKAILDNFYYNRYGQYMDQQYIDLQTNAMARYQNILDDLVAYANTNSLIY